MENLLKRCANYVHCVKYGVIIINKLKVIKIGLVNIYNWLLGWMFYWIIIIYVFRFNKRKRLEISRYAVP